MLNPLLESILKAVHQNLLKRHKLVFVSIPTVPCLVNENKSRCLSWRQPIIHCCCSLGSVPKPTVLLCSIWTRFVMLLRGPEACMHVRVRACVCIPATRRSTLAGPLWHAIYGGVIWSLSFSLRPKFLCPCATKISLCVRVNHLSYAHATLRKGQGCHLIPAALLSYLCASYSRPLAASRRGYPSTLFIPIAPTIRT